jgi:hypothetical protein
MRLACSAGLQCGALPFVMPMPAKIASGARALLRLL